MNLLDDHFFRDLMPILNKCGGLGSAVALLPNEEGEVIFVTGPELTAQTRERNFRITMAVLHKVGVPRE